MFLRHYERGGKIGDGVEENLDSVWKFDLGSKVPQQRSDVGRTRMAEMNVQDQLSGWY